MPRKGFCATKLKDNSRPVIICEIRAQILRAHRSWNLVSYFQKALVGFFAILLSQVLNGFIQQVSLCIGTVHYLSSAAVDKSRGDIKKENFLETPWPRIKPGLARWEARTLPLCYVDPLISRRFLEAFRLSIVRCEVLSCSISTTLDTTVELVLATKPTL